MPHCELSYSADLDLDGGEMLRRIEALILRHDADAGDTKGRAYPAGTFHHTHLKATISLLAKPHRGAAFTAALQGDVFDLLSRALPRLGPEAASPKEVVVFPCAQCFV